MTTPRGLVCAGAILGLAGIALADTWHFLTPLRGRFEVPPNTSLATGRAFGMYDDVTNTLHLDVVSRGFNTPTTAAHLHIGPPNGTGAPSIFFPGPFGGSSYHTHGVFVLTQAQEDAFLAGNTYVNIHTRAFAPGEIRGQVNPVPTPAGLTLLAVGALAGSRRRR